MQNIAMKKAPTPHHFHLQLKIRHLLSMTGQLLKMLQQPNALPRYKSVHRSSAKPSMQPHRNLFVACYIIAKNNLSLLPDDKFCCGVKARHSSVLKAVANLVNEKTRWDVVGPNGPDTEPNSMSLLLGWWTTEGI
jgi:hypothetical protein